MTQNKTAPTTTMISTFQKIIARPAVHARKQWSEKFHLQACRDPGKNCVRAPRRVLWTKPAAPLFIPKGKPAPTTGTRAAAAATGTVPLLGRQDSYTSAYTWRAGDADLTLFGTN